MSRAVVAVLFVVGCSGGGAAQGEVSASRSEVISGVASTDADDGVLILRTDRPKDTSVCSASLIAPNLLATARHCVVAEYPADNIRCNTDGTLMLPSGGELGAPSPPEQVHLFAGRQPRAEGGLPGGEPAALATRIITTDWPSVCRDDIALIVLDRELDLPLVPLALDAVVDKTTRVSVVGYGLSETSAESSRWSPRRRRNDVPIKYVDRLPNTFAVARAVCKGDSGGPALDSKTGALVGIYSLGFPGETVADCTSENALNYFAQVNRYPQLLRQAFEAAGQPFPDDQPGGGGAGGADGNAGGAPFGEPAAGGEPLTLGGNGGAPAEPPDSEQPESEQRLRAAGGCHLAGAASRSSAPLALLGIFALCRRRRR